MTLALSPIGIAALTPRREAHYARLAEGPELFVELQVRDATACQIDRAGEPIGYAIVGRDRWLLELELDHPSGALFGELVALLALRGALCFSFDAVLLALCGQCGWRSRSDGLLFRTLRDDPEAEDAARDADRFRPARLADGARVLPHAGDVFDDDAQWRDWITAGWVSALERGDELLGIGLATPVWATRREHDLGVLVLPEHRGQGHAVAILRMLKRRCLARGLRPTAGCAAGNVAARSALARAGFASEHALLAFEPAPGPA